MLITFLGTNGWYDSITGNTLCIIGLHTLDKFKFARPLIFLVQEGSTGTLQSFLDKPFTTPRNRLSFESKIMEVPREKNLLPFSVNVLDMLHADPTIGIRLTWEGKTISFCPDTGYCLNCIELARAADLLITECAFKPGESSQIWPHLNPESGAMIAKEAKAKQLVLTHFDASRYLTLADREDALSAARSVFPQTQISIDGWQIEL